MQSSNLSRIKLMFYLPTATFVSVGLFLVNFVSINRRRSNPSFLSNLALKLFLISSMRYFLLNESIAHAWSGYSVLITSWIYSALKNFVSVQLLYYIAFRYGSSIVRMLGSLTLNNKKGTSVRNFPSSTLSYTDSWLKIPKLVDFWFFLFVTGRLLWSFLPKMMS